MRALPTVLAATLLGAGGFALAATQQAPNEPGARQPGAAQPQAASASATPAPSPLAAPLWEHGARHQLRPQDPHIPHPAPQTRPAIDEARENQRCEACHQDIGREWRASMHRSSAVDPLFVASHRVEPRSFCVDCHDPEGVAEIGVGCVTCHMPTGPILGARAREADANAHAVTASAVMSTSLACVGCHDFPFPGEKRSLQRTHMENEQSAFAKTSCQDCHMPVRQAADGKRYRSHDFHVLGDRNFIRSALRVTARRQGEMTVLLTLHAGRIGHAFPTGDLFRKLEARASTVDSEPVVRATPVAMTRVFENLPQLGRVEVADTRLGPPGTPTQVRELELRFPSSVAGRKLRYELYYQRMDEPTAKLLGVDPRADEFLLTDGELAAPGPAGSP